MRTLNLINHNFLFQNDLDPLPEGVTSSNGTLMISEAKKSHSGNYTCKASDGDQNITARITLDVVGKRVEY